MKLFDLIKMDLSRYKERYGSKSTFLNINIYICILYRISHFFFSKNYFVISKIFWLINRIVFSVDIDPGAKFKKGLLLIHPIGIVIGRKVVAKGKVTIYQGVTIGGNSGKVDYFEDKKVEQPIFGDDIILSPGCKVLGPIKIGDNVKVGANSVITETIEPDTIAVGFNKSINNK